MIIYGLVTIQGQGHRHLNSLNLSQRENFSKLEVCQRCTFPLWLTSCVRTQPPRPHPEDRSFYIHWPWPGLVYFSLTFHCSEQSDDTLLQYSLNSYFHQQRQHKRSSQPLSAYENMSAPACDAGRQSWPVTVFFVVSAVTRVPCFCTALTQGALCNRVFIPSAINQISWILWRKSCGGRNECLHKTSSFESLQLTTFWPWNTNYWEILKGFFLPYFSREYIIMYHKTLMVSWCTH